eukprot:m.92345 g.92345  ORF g.92345 m.92345 type:complete len:301 (-) comp12034_c0_seq2:2605-3507(-)
MSGPTEHSRGPKEDTRRSTDVLNEAVDWSEVSSSDVSDARASPLSFLGGSPPSTPPARHRFRVSSIGSSGSSHRGSPISQDLVNPRLRRIRSTTSIEAFSDNELDHERDVMETNKLAHGISALPSPRCTSANAAAFADWTTDCDGSFNSGNTSLDSASFSSDVGIASGSPVGGSAGSGRPPVSPGAVVARRRMSQGCRPVSETVNRPSSPLHRCSTTKAENAGKSGSGSPRKSATARLSRMGGSSLRHKSPTRFDHAAAALGVDRGPRHVVRGQPGSPFDETDAHLHDPEPPAFTGFTGT